MNPTISELLPGGAKVLKDIKRQKTPVLITQNGRPAAYLMDVNTYQRLEKRMRILEGIARGETAILEGRTLSHSEAKRRMKRWLD
ncbi:MAG TPA: type II toxin-antitoxin system prevent-host-death family antitoxin [Blastocatellia bacterium]|nr:type II toxin-antitoxin system prevent-host-death family antitoxin [Blastocatellia bacterium]